MLQEAEAATRNIDRDAAVTFMRESINQLTPLLFNAVGALVVFVVGLWIAGKIKHLVVVGMRKSGRVDDTLVGFLSSVVHYGVIALVVITTLGIFGVPTASFAAVIAAAGLAIGLALQGTLGNIASGVMMLGLRPFHVGDFVQIGGVEGTVKSITLFTTDLATLDNKKVIIPNAQVWEDAIVNFSANDTRRVDIIFGVSYGDDLNKAIDAVRSAIEAEERVFTDPPPAIGVDSLGDSSVNITSRSWVKASDYLSVKWALNKAVKERFDEVGVTIPFPTRQLVHTPMEAEED